MEGSGQSWVVHIPHSQPAAGAGLPSNSPTLQPEAPSCPLPWPLGPLAPFTGEIVIMWCLSPAPGVTALPPPHSRGCSRGLWPKEYIHVARQGAGALHFTPSPPNGSGGGSPTPGPEWKFCCPDSQMRLAPAGPLPSTPSATWGGEVAWPICATFPQSSKAKGLLWPRPRTSLPQS